MLRELRRAGFAPDWQRAQTEQDFLALLDPTLDLILADYRMPQFDASRALHLTRARGLDIPFIIIVPGAVGEDSAVALLQQGATDYLLEDRLARLGEAVRRALEQKRLLAKEIAERNRWKAIVESSADAILGVSLEGVILSWNAGAERLYGYTREEVAGRPADFLAPPDRPDEIPRILARLKRGEHLDRFETVRVRKDGKKIDVSLTISPIKDAAGHIIGASSIVHDISERRRGEEAVRTSDERYRGLFAGVPVGLYRATVGGEILEANPALLQMLGCADLETLRKKSAAGLYVDREARQKWLALLEKEGVVSGHESQLRKFDGSVIWVLASARIIHDSSGRGAYIEGAVEDITDHKQAQEAIVRAREAAHANKAKSEFLSRMSQELRTPLNSILGFAQLLDIDPLRPDQRENVGQILKSGRRVVELINEVLDLARIEAGQTAISLELVPLHESLRETLTLIAPLATKANIRLHVETAGAPERHILANRQRFKEALLNLLTNAVKYNRPGGSVTLSYEDAGQRQLRIKVSDTGPGIPKEKMPRLFAPFDRLGAEQTELEGTGLGLALCKHLVEAMGGTLGVESVEGRGSTFWLKFAHAEAPS